MRCYYEELGIARDASDTDIKTAYRKQALRWHPDKNPEMLEEAKKRFLLIQQAYSVLSDQKEKAWYDNHREQILRGTDSEYKEKNLNVFEYFTQSCYEGYGDDPKSFYSVYSGVFQKIALEDAEFMEDSVEISSIPIFGKKDSSYEDVVGPFYAYWQSYNTRKTYEWLYPFDITQIKDRYTFRKMEKECKKIALNARKQRNEEVRNLVSFIRKRDNRVHLHREALEERNKLNRQKQKEYRMEHLRQRKQDLAALYKSGNDGSDDRYETELQKLDRHYISYLESKRTDVDDSKSMVEETATVDAIVEKGRNELELSEAQLILDAEHNKKNKKSKKKKTKSTLNIDSDTGAEEKIDDFLTQQTVDSSDTEDWSINKKGAKKKKNKKCKGDNFTNKHKMESKFTDQSTGNEHDAQTSEDHAQTLEHVCHTCKSIFNSKNKLFAHLKETDHAVSTQKLSTGSVLKPSKVKHK